MNLKEMWKEYMKIYNKGVKLWDKGFKYNSMCEWDEANRVWKERDRIFFDFIDENYGKKTDWQVKDDKITLTNGVILYLDGRVYEPLEVVMRRIIKEHEEK